MIKKLYYKFIPSSRKKSMATRFTRSTFGNICCFVLITAAGLFSMLPLIYAVVTSFKPIDELLIFPPTFFVRRPTTENYVALPTLLYKENSECSRKLRQNIYPVGIYYMQLRKYYILRNGKGVCVEHKRKLNYHKNNFPALVCSL